MKFTPIAAALALTVAALLPAQAATAAHDHGHSQSHAAPTAALHLNAGQKWETDAPLRQAMARLRQHMAPALGPIHAKRLPAAEYARLGREVEAAVADIVAQCKLPPEADAQLHLVVAELLQGAEQMTGQRGKPRNGALQVVSALDSYARYFADPDFRPLAH